MFEEFSEYLTLNIKNENFWYDYACSEANNMLLSFNKQDWDKLTEFLPSQNIDWQKICFELVANDTDWFAKKFVIHFLCYDNFLLQYFALDTLNEHLFSNFLSNNEKYLFRNILSDLNFPQNELGVQYLLASVLNKLNK